MRLHLVSLPHAQTIKSLSTCAFTSKNIKFTKMMGERGWEIFLYSGDCNDAEYARHVTLYSAEEQYAWYGDIDPNTLPTKAGIWDSESDPWRITNERAIKAIRENAEPHDIVLLTGGYAQKMISDALPELLCVEHAAGYEGIFSNYVCFESEAWKHYLYGKHGWDGRWFDTVIPNFFDPDEWTLGPGKGDHLLFVGRMVTRKGVGVASEIAKACGRKLILAGSGVVSHEPGRIVCEELVLEGDHLEYVGTVGPKERDELMGDAYAVLVPTTYVEPFGAVAVEAQLSGTPTITTDWGAFTETVSPEFRFRTLAEGIAAVERAGSVDRAELREQALARWSFDALAPMYERWFAQLSSLWGKGWYELSDTSEGMKEIIHA
jgi:glycosyltransferase involved in cell wall biosynthesis